MNVPAALGPRGGPPDDHRSSLEAVGVSAQEEAVYRVLLREGRVSAAEVARGAGMSPGRCRQMLATLERKGLVTRSAGRPVSFAPVPPDLAIDALALRATERIHDARLTAQRLLAEFSHDHGELHPSHAVDVVEGAEAVRTQLVQMQKRARQEIRRLARPPFLSLQADEVEIDQLHAGVRCRAVYDVDSFEVAGIGEAMQAQVDAGEQARVAAGVPVKLGVADDQLAVVPLETGAGSVGAALLIRPSALLDALIALFEHVWASALPIDGSHAPSRGDQQPSGVDRMLLVLLSSGLQDEAIARRLGVGLRTVRRRVAALLDELDADTRFQAGVRAAERGWIRGPSHHDDGDASAP